MWGIIERNADEQTNWWDDEWRDKQIKGLLTDILLFEQNCPQ